MTEDTLEFDVYRVVATGRLTTTPVDLDVLYFLIREDHLLTRRTSTYVSRATSTTTIRKQYPINRIKRTDRHAEPN